MSTLLELATAALSGPVVWKGITYLWNRLRRDPKTEAEARRINAEADTSLADRLWREINRLDSELKEVRDELASVKREAAAKKRELERSNKHLRERITALEKLDHERATREAGLERENQGLRQEVSLLRARVGQLEEIIYECTTPEDMRAALDKLKDVK